MGYIWQLRNYPSIWQKLISPYGVIIYLGNDFSRKTTMNAKVNNWGVELSDSNIKFQFIKGVKNTLADTLSRLIDLELME